jgi:hypothetical protein
MTLAQAVELDRGQFVVEYIDCELFVRRTDLSRAWRVPFESVRPVRTFPSYKGQSNFPGWWWSATLDRHVGYESWLERDHVMLLDYDTDVVAFSSQPFWLHWRDGRRGRRHAPDYFVRRADGTAVVLDVRADDRIDEEDAAAFEAMRQACRSVGWDFRRSGVVAAVLCRNLRWLSRYRHQRCAGDAAICERLIEVFAHPLPLMHGAARVGDTLRTLPALFHLLWRRALTADLDKATLDATTPVSAASGRLR